MTETKARPIRAQTPKDEYGLGGTHFENGKLTPGATRTVVCTSGNYDPRKSPTTPGVARRQIGLFPKKGWE
jgi:hypothetical protein